MADWLRWWHGSVTDRKFGAVCLRAKCTLPEVIAVWASLLEHASQAEDRGDISDCPADEIAWALRIEPETVSAIITAMEERGLLAEGRLAGWDRRQPLREDAIAPDAKTGAQRQKEFRDRRRVSGEASNATVTQSNATVTHQSRAEQSRDRTEVNPVPQAAAVAEREVDATPILPPLAGEVGESLDLTTSDPITGRACELAGLLRKRGADLQASNPLVRQWAADGVTDAQALTALELAESRRANSRKPQQAVNAGLLNAILPDIRTTAPGGGARASPRDTERQARRKWAEELTTVTGQGGQDDGRTIDA